MSAARSKLNFTDAASKGSPFWNLTPARSLKVQVFRSGLTVQRSASSGVVRLSLVILVSVSNTLYSTTSAMALAAPAVGSRPGGSSVIPSTALSLRGWASAAAGASAASAAAPSAQASAARRVAPGARAFCFKLIGDSCTRGAWSVGRS